MGIVLTAEQKQALRIVARRGAENAESALSKWMRKPVSMRVGEVDMLPFSRVAGLVGGETAVIVAVAVRLEGDLGGALFCVYSEASAKAIAAAMLGRLRKPAAPAPGELSDMEQSVLQETVNIVASAYLNAFGSSLGFRLAPTPPFLGMDMAGCLMEMLWMEYAAAGNEVMLIPIDFTHPDGALDWRLFIQPDPRSLAKLLEKIRA